MSYCTFPKCYVRAVARRLMLTFLVLFYDFASLAVLGLPKNESLRKNQDIKLHTLILDVVS